MPTIVYRINTLLTTLLRRVPLGTNLGLLSLMWALLSGRLLHSRGALFPALSDLGLSDDAVRRASAALTYGRFQMADLIHDWNQLVVQEGQFQPHSHAGIRPVSVDLVGFFRPKLVGCTTKHYPSQADKALPALTFGMVGATGSVGGVRLCLPRLLVEADPQDKSEADPQKRTVIRAAQTRAPNEALIFDAGFPLKDLLSVKDLVFVVRGAKNVTARRNYLPAYPGKGRPADAGEVVRPLARSYRGKTIPATPPDARVEWTEGEYTLQAFLFNDLVLSDAKPGSPSFRCVVIIDPRYREPLVLETNLAVSVSAQAVRGLYRDRWPVEQMPLAAKQMLGAARSFVFAPDSRTRLPQLALLAGNVLSYVAATSAPVATGFWDRRCRPTCGHLLANGDGSPARVRRMLSRLHFSDLALETVEEGLGRQVRKKASVTEHLRKGVEAHRRTKAVGEPLTARLAA